MYDKELAREGSRQGRSDTPTLCKCDPDIQHKRMIYMDRNGKCYMEEKFVDL